ncbi:hypothetical protein [Streptomyces sp. AK02-04a]|uniref:hypothetical protein n=1 Tax=Streptomyces sp. AK02-04a TaxID=3028649 RepID=UPI0029A69B46|nr:hypothetical protein [Streptomyces sp. AK02-04a]MDX3759316.1 hypothetical protein [Streptomyces sp. AK02-04a]
MGDTFQDRMNTGSEAVYAAIERGDYQGQGTAPIESALLDAQLDASGDEQDGDL